MVARSHIYVVRILPVLQIIEINKVGILLDFYPSAP